VGTRSPCAQLTSVILSPRPPLQRRLSGHQRSPISQEGTLSATLRDWTKPLWLGQGCRSQEISRGGEEDLPAPSVPSGWGSCRPQGLYGVDAQKSPRTRPARDSRALERGGGGNHVTEPVTPPSPSMIGSLLRENSQSKQRPDTPPPFTSQ
jgi:hypothetical protein